MDIRFQHGDKEQTCRALLEALPDWFGIPSAIDRYAASANALPMLVAEMEGEVAGCITLRELAPGSWDIEVIAVTRAYHRQGLGRALVEAAAKYCRNRGGRFLSVKTIGPSYDDADYAATRRFYEGTGFTMQEEFPNFWNEVQPMAIYIMPL